MRVENYKQRKAGTKQEEPTAYKFIPLAPDPILSVSNSLLWMVQDVSRVFSSVFNVCVCVCVCVCVHIHIYIISSIIMLLLTSPSECKLQQNYFLRIVFE